MSRRIPVRVITRAENGILPTYRTPKMAEARHQHDLNSTRDTRHAPAGDGGGRGGWRCAPPVSARRQVSSCVRETSGGAGSGAWIASKASSISGINLPPRPPSLPAPVRRLEVTQVVILPNVSHFTVFAFPNTTVADRLYSWLKPAVLQRVYQWTNDLTLAFGPQIDAVQTICNCSTKRRENRETVKKVIPRAKNRRVRGRFRRCETPREGWSCGGGSCSS